MSSERTIRVTVWGENVQERQDPAVTAIYPEGMHHAIAGGIAEKLNQQATVQTTTLHDTDCGLSDSILENTDVLVWWSHLEYEAVADERAARVVERVLRGMGFLALHSAHIAKPFLKLMTTSCKLRFGSEQAQETVWTVTPRHPIAAGVAHPFVIPKQETYCEPHDIPSPSEVVFISSFSGGEVFRSGCCFHRGGGRIFYFSPGHETFPVYRQDEVKTIISNAVLWCHQTHRIPKSSDPGGGWYDG